MRIRATLTTFLALALLVAACGGDSDDETTASDTRPNDFSFTFQHVDGSVPPPFHAEWTIAVEADGSGKATYVPDYGGDGVPTYESEFTVDDAQLDTIYSAFRDAGLLEDVEAAEDPPIGGAIESIVIEADGETYDVPGFDEDDTSRAGEVADDIVALVPAKDWASFEKRRDAYAMKEYGERP